MTTRPNLLTDAFRSLSARLGQDPLQVQGPGGNTSIKGGDVMWIKASGTELAQATAQDLSDMLHLSARQIGRRRQRLEAEGYIQGYRARLDAPRLGLSVQGFAQVHLGLHGAEHAASFAKLVPARPELHSAWPTTGDAD